VTLALPQLLEQVSATLRAEIAPAVTGEYPRTQAFMAVVVVEKAARQLALAAQHDAADRADRSRLFADVAQMLGTVPAPAAVRVIADEGVTGPNTAVLCRLIESLYLHRDELGPMFDALLTRVRASLRAQVDRQLEYAS
jgi:hypothetical protein